MNEIKRMRLGVNEYMDKLCNQETSELLKELGCDKYSPECWIIDEKGNISDSWTGLTPEGCKIHSYRYTLAWVQKWIMENYDIYVSPYIVHEDKWRYTIEYINFSYGDNKHFKVQETKDWSSVKLETYDEALEFGLIEGLQKIS
jgi:hypothetical protein